MVRNGLNDPSLQQEHDTFRQVMILPARHRAQMPLCVPIIIRCPGNSISCHNSAAYQVTLTIDAVNNKWLDPADTGEFIEGGDFESRRANVLVWNPDGDYYYFAFDQPSTLKHIEFKRLSEEKDFVLRAVLKCPDSGKTLETCTFNLTVYPDEKGAPSRSLITAEERRRKHIRAPLNQGF